MLAGQVWATHTIEIGNLKYTVTDEINHYVSVGTKSTLTGALEIPSQIEVGGGTIYSVTGISNVAFNSCRNLTSVTIPNSVTTIGDGAFNDCSSLTTITIPESVTTIGGSVFAGCSRLTEIKVENNNTSFSSQNGVLFNKNMTTIVCFPNGKSETTYTIPNSVTCIYDGAFQKSNGLTSVSIPNSVTTIGDYAFQNCSNLTSITIPNSVTSIGSNAFEVCRGLTSVTIPNSVITIGDAAFSYCNNLQYNEYNNAYYLGNIDNPYLYLVSAKSTNITDCEINKNCRFIGSAFVGCSSLTTVIIPESVTSIGGVAFRNCSSLTSVSIPNTVTSIGCNAA